MNDLDRYIIKKALAEGLFEKLSYAQAEFQAEELEKAAAGYYDTKISKSEIKSRIADIRATKGYDAKKAKINKLYSDTFGEDYKSVLKGDKDFKHSTRPKSTTINRSVAHGLYAGPVLGTVIGQRGAQRKRVTSLEKSMDRLREPKEKAAAASYDVKIPKSEIRSRLADIRATKGYDHRQDKLDKLYSDTFGKDYKDVLRGDKRFKHTTRPAGTTASRSVAHSLWAGPILGPIAGHRGAQRKRIKSLEKALERERLREPEALKKQAGLGKILGKVFGRRSWADKAKALSPAPKLKRPVTPLKITSGGVPLEKVLRGPRKQIGLPEQSALKRTLKR